MGKALLLYTYYVVQYGDGENDRRRIFLNFQKKSIVIEITLFLDWSVK